jgi:membrane dipeptidase
MLKLLMTAALLSSLTAGAQNYEALHRGAIVVDTHNDALSLISMRGLPFDGNLKGRTHSDLDRMFQGGVDVQVFSVFCNERFGKDTAFKYANIEIDSLLAVIARNPNRMQLVESPAALRKAVRAGKLGCMLGVEGGHMIEDSLAYLEAFYKRGVRYMTLTWNNSLSWATSAADETSRGASLPFKGLTPFGRQVVRRMNDLGMIVDVSHVGEQTFWDVMATTTRPVIASHSCAYSLCPVPRNLKDEQIRAIARNGGVIHLNFYSGFIDSSYEKRKEGLMQKYRSKVDSLKALKMPNYEIEEWLMNYVPQEAEGLRPRLEQLIDHLDHIVKLAGVDHVGLGSDFDGISSAPRGLEDVTGMPLITRELLRRGYTKKDIRKILGANFIRVFTAVQATKN